MTKEEVFQIIDKASILCRGCALKETWVWPPKSLIVGQAAVHSSGLICIPNTIKKLIEQET